MTGLPNRHHALLLTFLSLCTVLSGCVGYEPNRLVPSISLAPEDLELVGQAQVTGQGGVDFGITGALNESDSLFNVETLPGVRIRSVAANGPADLAGLQAGDVILTVNGTEVNHPDTLQALALQGADAAEFTFRIRRATAVLEATLIGRARATAGAPLRELYRSDPLASRAGYETVVLEVREQGQMSAARIVDLAADSPMIDAGMQSGDVILGLDGEPIQSAQGLINSLLTDYQLGDTVMFTVYRGDSLDERRVRLWDPGRRINRVSLRPLLVYESSLANQQSRFSLLDFWVFSVYRYDRNESEREHRFLELFSVSSEFGELVEETTSP